MIQGMIHRSNGGGAAGLPNPMLFSRFYEEFSGNTNAFEASWSVNVDGDASVGASSAVADPKHPGIARLNVGTGALNYSNLNRSDNTGWLFGGGRVVFSTSIRIEDLATAGEDYTLRIGLGTHGSSGEHANGMYFEYERSSSVNWRLETADGGVRTTVAISIVVAADSWLRLRIEANAAGSQADFYVNDALAGSVAVALPLAAPKVSTPNFQFFKLAGTTSRVIDVDYCAVDTYFSSAR